VIPNSRPQIYYTIFYLINVISIGHERFLCKGEHVRICFVIIASWEGWQGAQITLEVKFVSMWWLNWKKWGEDFYLSRFIMEVLEGL